MHSHKAFRAPASVRFVLSLLGASGFQGSIKWWALRHRLHHRFTDDPNHDPYCATNGLLWSHMGWIFFKPSYRKMSLIERDDLDRDPVVRFQHNYYIPIALFTGFVFPTMMGLLWKDVVGSFIYGGLLPRIMTWHCTFLVNSLAHWDGLQPYSDENTSRGNLIMGMLTCGEGNHNFHHSFPHDYRSGPSPYDWDPSKWIIFTLSHFGLASSLRRARTSDITEALVYMKEKGHHHHHHSDSDGDLHSEVSSSSSSGSNSGSGGEEEEANVREEWDETKVGEYLREKSGRCVLVVNGYVVDVTSYMKEHPGGSLLLRKYAFPSSASSTPALTSTSRPNKLEAVTDSTETIWEDASWAFNGGMNRHTRAARKQMRELVVARFKPKVNVI